MLRLAGKAGARDLQPLTMAARIATQHRLLRTAATAARPAHIWAGGGGAQQRWAQQRLAARARLPGGGSAPRWLPVRSFASKPRGRRITAAQEAGIEKSKAMGMWLGGLVVGMLGV